MPPGVRGESANGGVYELYYSLSTIFIDPNSIIVIILDSTP
jgi:hypothetical protein